MEHNTKVILLFVDLRKMYDSVPRASLWCTLQRRSIPDVMIELVRSLHDGMSATVTARSGRSEPFSFRNGLHQGCTVTPQFVMACIKGVLLLLLCLFCTLVS